MRRQPLRIRVAEDGGLEIVDPGIAELELLREIDPGFAVAGFGEPPASPPRLLSTRSIGCGIARQTASTLAEPALWELHSRAMHDLKAATPKRPSADELQLLELKRMLAEQLAQPCRLCARRCAAPRRAGMVGPCGLGMDAYVAEHFVHIGEERLLNPSLVFNLRGCALRCRFCQQHRLLKAKGTAAERLSVDLWKEIDPRGARSMSFVGGNPDESLPAILRFLETMPHDLKLPIWWNNHAYSSPETLTLLDGVVDGYVPDYKYGRSECGRALSGVIDYPAAARRSVSMMLNQAVPVVVRILVLPNHVDCCHLPVLDTLASLRQSNLIISVRGQYAPDWKIGPTDASLNRRPSLAEIQRVSRHAQALGLKLSD